MVFGSVCIEQISQMYPSRIPIRSSFAECNSRCSLTNPTVQTEVAMPAGSTN